MTDETTGPPAGAPQPGGARPPGSSSRRRRRGRGRGSRAANPPAAGAPASPAPSPPPSQARARGEGGRGRGDRGSRRGGGSGDRGGRRPPQQPAQPQAARELEITDEKIFQRLLDSGLDLSQEAILEAFLYFAGETPARRVAAQLAEGGYETYVDPNPPGRWLLEAVSRGIPTPEHISSMGAELKAAARSSNGIYDGWWASPVPEEEDAAVPLVLESEPSLIEPPEPAPEAAENPA